MDYYYNLFRCPTDEGLDSDHPHLLSRFDIYHTVNPQELVLCQDLVQVKMRNFSHFNLPKAQP